jgi:c-di-GMP-binding flagellar brake protein YcgR
VQAAHLKTAEQQLQPRGRSPDDISFISTASRTDKRAGDCTKGTIVTAYRGENRRRFVRYKGAAKATVRRGKEELRGTLENISHNGAGLLLPAELPVGEAISAMLMTPRLERIQITGEVIHVHPQNGQFVVGVKLDEWLKPERLEELRSMRG